jgi:hypothetical protein
MCSGINYFTKLNYRNPAFRSHGDSEVVGNILEIFIFHHIKSCELGKLEISTFAIKYFQGYGDERGENNGS